MQDGSNPVEVSRRFFGELWNNHNLDVADDLFTEESVTHQMRSAPGPVTTAPRRPEDIKRELGAWFASFPDARIEIENQSVDGNEVITQCVFTGTHTGAWFGVAPTHRQCVVRMILRQRISEGRIVEDWLLADWHGFLAQLGILPPLEAILQRGAE